MNIPGLLEIACSTLGLYIAFSIKRSPLFRTKLCSVYFIVLLLGIFRLVEPYRFLDYKSTLSVLIIFLLTILYWREVKCLTTNMGFYKQSVVDLLDEIPDLLWVKDLEGKFIYTNRACREKMLLNSEDFVFGKTCKEISDALTESGRPSNFGDVCTISNELVIEAKRPKRFMETYSIDGHNLVFQVYITPILDKHISANGISDELVKGTIGLARDYTSDYNDHCVILKLLEANKLECAIKKLKSHAHKFEFNI